MHAAWTIEKARSCRSEIQLQILCETPATLEGSV